MLSSKVLLLTAGSIAGACCLVNPVTFDSAQGVKCYFDEASQRLYALDVQKPGAMVVDFEMRHHSSGRMESFSDEKDMSARYEIINGQARCSILEQNWPSTTTRRAHVVHSYNALFPKNV